MVADNVEKQDIRGLDIDKLLKGFSLTEYIFKNLVTKSPTSADTIRWYQETPADLTASAPSTFANVSPLSSFPIAEVTWTRNTSYTRKYAVEGFISMEDIATADVDVLARSVLRLTRAVAKQVDTRIYNVLTESQSPSLIGTSAAVGGSWVHANANPIADILSGAQAVMESDYDPSGLVVAMTPKNHKELLNYIITTKGSSIPAFSSEKVRSGVVMNIVGADVVVSNNVVAASVFVGLPARACTWKSRTPLTSTTIPDPGIGTKIRVWEEGEAILTDPKASYLITATG